MFQSSIRSVRRATYTLYRCGVQAWVQACGKHVASMGASSGARGSSTGLARSCVVTELKARVHLEESITQTAGGVAREAGRHSRHRVPAPARGGDGSGESEIESVTTWGEERLDHVEAVAVPLHHARERGHAEDVHMESPSERHADRRSEKAERAKRHLREHCKLSEEGKKLRGVDVARSVDVEELLDRYAEGTEDGDELGVGHHEGVDIPN